jgi:hypothetical protein
MYIFSAAAMIGDAMCMIIVIADLKVVRWRTLSGAAMAAVAGMAAAAGVGESGEPHNS